MPGVYTVTVQAHGYKPRTMVISVRRNRPTKVNFVLKPIIKTSGCGNLRTLEEEGYLVGGFRAALRQFGFLGGECAELIESGDAVQESRDNIRAFPWFFFLQKSRPHLAFFSSKELFVITISSIANWGGGGGGGAWSWSYYCIKSFAAVDEQSLKHCLVSCWYTACWLIVRWQGTVECSIKMDSYVLFIFCWYITTGNHCQEFRSPWKSWQCHWFLHLFLKGNGVEQIIYKQCIYCMNVIA